MLPSVFCGKYFEILLNMLEEIPLNMSFEYLNILLIFVIGLAKESFCYLEVCTFWPAQ